jgi:hypothetical protein
MGTEARFTPTARIAAVLALGALGLHELRYLVAFGGQAGEELARAGHDYLALIAPALLALSLSFGAAAILMPALLGEGPGRRAPFAARWLALSAAMVVVFCAQELAEGALAPGHAAGLAGVFGSGGWLALPLALALGAPGAVLLGGLRRAGELVARALAPPLPGAPAAPPAGPSADPGLLPLAALALAFGFARRPPPLVASD